MASRPDPETAKTPPPRGLSTFSSLLSDGTVVELVYDPTARRTAFLAFREGNWRLEREIRTPEGERLLPYRPENNLLRHEVVLLPSEPAEYGSERELLARILSFIHRHVQVSEDFEALASHYALFSWVYDAFSETPYLRVRGDYGSGKSRFLQTVGSLCYKPIFASGASTVSPLFRILDSVRGTLVIDEGDFRASDERAEIVKILNNGNARGFPVLRSEVTSKREFDPRAYAVFGPKIIATRGFFDDPALESRCLTEEMGRARLREDITLNLPATFRDEALALRNQLLLFRCRHIRRAWPIGVEDDRTLEPRLRQILAPLLATVAGEDERSRVLALARDWQRRLVADRGLDTEAQLLAVVRDLLAASEEAPTVKEIADLYAERHGADHERRITPKWVGWMLRRKLQLHPQRRRGTFVLPREENRRLELLFARYGLEPRGTGQDLGDVGDVAGVA